MRRLAPHLQSGDLIFFASTRKNLDAFHAGIIVREGKSLLIRHASRSQGRAVEQQLSEFLKANRMAGRHCLAAARSYATHCAAQRWREAAGCKVNIVYPKDYSSASIQGLVDGADSEVLFFGDPRVDIEPGPHMFDRMTRVIRETGAGWVYADAAGHPRIDYQKGIFADGFCCPCLACPLRPRARRESTAPGNGEDYTTCG